MVFLQRRFDLVSAALSVVAIIPVVFAIKTVATHGVTTTALATVAIGVAAGWTFLRRQRHLASPLLDITLFSRPAFAGAVAAVEVLGPVRRSSNALVRVIDDLPARLVPLEP